MKKKLLLMSVGLLVAAILAAVVLPLFINANNFKNSVVAELWEATGYQFIIDGDVHIRLFPVASLKVEKVSVKSPRAGKPFAQVRELDVGVSTLSLFRGKVEIQKIHLNEPVLTLVRDGKTNNWQSESQSLDAVKRQAANNNQKQGSAPRNIIFHNINISNGSLSYKDGGAPAITLSKLDLNANAGSITDPFSLKAKAVLNNQNISLSAKLGALTLLWGDGGAPFSAVFDSDALKFSLEGEATEGGRLSGKVDIKTTSIAAMQTLLTGKAGNSSAPVAIDLKGPIACTRRECTMQDVLIKVNATTLIGLLKSDFGNERLIFYAEFSTDKLDLSPYIAKKAEGFNIISSAHAASPRWSDKPIDLSILNAADATFTLEAAEFIANRLASSAVTLKARNVAGSLNLSANGKLYGGTGKTTLNMNTGGLAEYTVDLKGVNIEPLLVAMNGESKIAGKADIRAELNSSGKSEQALVSNLSGGGSFNFNDGSLKGVDIISMVKNVRSAFTGEAASQSKTDFAELGGTFNIKSGIVTNNDLSMKAPLMRVAGKGTVNLPDWRIDYLLTPQLVETSTGQGGKDKSGIGVPIRVTGSLDNPNYTPDLSGALQDAIKDPKKFKENLKDSRESVKDLLKQGKGLLKGL